MLVIITIKAAFDIENTDDLEEIGQCIHAALEDLQGIGAARVESAAEYAELSLDAFIRQEQGLTEFEFELKKPTRARIDFD